jgi:hypothetical protein
MDFEIVIDGMKIKTILSLNICHSIVVFLHNNTTSFGGDLKRRMRKEGRK